jgi:hypothetical protein
MVRPSVLRSWLDARGLLDHRARSHGTRALERHASARGSASRVGRRRHTPRFGRAARRGTTTGSAGVTSRDARLIPSCQYVVSLAMVAVSSFEPTRVMPGGSGAHTSRRSRNCVKLGDLWTGTTTGAPVGWVVVVRTHALARFHTTGSCADRLAQGVRECSGFCSESPFICCSVFLVLECCSGASERLPGFRTKRQLCP